MKSSRFVEGFEMEKIIDEGAFGAIYKGTDIETKQQKVAIKKESVKFNFLINEYNILRELNSDSNSFGIPKAYIYSSADNYNYLVMDLLDKNLESFYSLNNCVIPMKVIILLAHQMLDRLKFIHEKEYVHRDIKPENFMFDEEGKILYLIDFGLAKKFSNPNALRNLKRGMVGTASFCSIDVHKGKPYLPKHDIESVLYIISYLLNRKLPWFGITGETKKEKYKKIYKKKLSISPSDLFKMLPPEFAEMLSYIRNLPEDNEVDYSFLKDKLDSIWNRYGYGDKNIQSFYQKESE